MLGDLDAVGGIGKMGQQHGLEVPLPNKYKKGASPLPLSQVVEGEGKKRCANTDNVIVACVARIV